MVFSYMILQVNFLNSSKWTVSAGKGPLPSVDTDMGVEVGLLGGAEGAVRTGERLFARVGADVVGHGVYFVGGAVTVRALIGFGLPVAGGATHFNPDGTARRRRHHRSVTRRRYL